MMTPFLPLLLSAAAYVGPVAEPGGEPAELARRAEGEFAEGVRLRTDADRARRHFRSAAELYDRLHHEGVRNALLYRNQGNAWFLAGDVARAILAYRRGLQLEPGDRTLRDALAAARGRVSHPARTGPGRPPADARPPWLPHPDENWVCATGLALYAAGWALVARWLVVRRGGALVLAVGALAGAAVLGAWLLADQRGRSEAPLVVVAEDGVLLRKGDGLAYPPRVETPLNRGVEATLLGTRGGWVQVELTGGEVGWVPREYVLLDPE